MFYPSKFGRKANHIYCRATHAFTLIELMIVITLIGILFSGSYIPYDYYSRLSKIRISAEKIHQSMEDARILAQNGQIFPGSTKNANTGLLLKKGSHTIDMFAFIPGTRSFIENPNAKIIKTITLEDWINITNLPQENILLEYSAPNGNMEIYINTTETGSSFDIGIGWKELTSGSLYKSIEIKK